MNTWAINIVPAGASETETVPLAKLNGVAIPGNVLEVRLQLRKFFGAQASQTSLSTLNANLGAFLEQGPGFDPVPSAYAASGAEPATLAVENAAEAPSPGFDAMVSLEIIVEDTAGGAVVLTQSTLGAVASSKGGAIGVSASATANPRRSYRSRPGDTINIVDPTLGTTIASFVVPGGGEAASYVTFDSGAVNP